MKKILFGLLPLLVIFAGCEGLENESISKEEFESAFEYEFNENVKYYDEDLTEYVSLINDTTMLIKSGMPARYIPETGDVILCTSTTNTPRGFLRRVKSINSGTTGFTVYTESAIITDAFKTLRFEQNFDYAECVKEFRDSLGNKIPFEIITDTDSTQTKVAGEAELGEKVIKLDVGNRFFKGHAYIKSDIYVKYDIGLGKVDVTYVIKKKIGLKGKATISSGEMFGKDYEDDFSFPILDKSVPFGTPIGPPLMQFFPSLNFGIAFAGNGDLSLEGEVNYILENTESRYSYKNGVEEKSVKNLLERNSSWMKMVNLEATGEFGLQGSVGIELRLWNGDLLAFGGEGALWYGMRAEGKISMDDESLLKETHEISIHPSLSATLYIESYFINNRKHRIEATVERSFENFNVSLLPEFEFEENNAGSKLTVTPTVEPVCMMEVSQQGFALFTDNEPDKPITHRPLPSSTIIETVPTAQYAEVRIEPEPVVFSLPSTTNNDVEYFAKPYVVADGNYYYGDGGVDRWVDLGLPSGILWAKYNVGATSPEEYGGYYAWGETEEKSSYNNDTYKYASVEYCSECKRSYYKFENIGECISGTKYDVAHIKWGDGARMPKLNEVEELYNNCSFKIDKYNDIFGVYMTGPNGNSIFIPYSGAYNESGLCEKGKSTALWSSSHLCDEYGTHGIDFGAYAMKFWEDQLYAELGYADGTCGLSVRAVKEKDSTEDQAGTVG